MGTFELLNHTALTRIIKMLCFAVTFCLLGATLAQTTFTPRPTKPDWYSILAWKLNGYDDTVDRVHEWRIEYHHQPDKKHLLIAISDNWPNLQCHFVEIDPQWESVMQDPAKVQLISEELYHHIKSQDVPETQLTEVQLLAIFGDKDSVGECVNHTVYVMSYTPSAAVLNLTTLPPRTTSV